jgi:hypothetical protein
MEYPIYRRYPNRKHFFRIHSATTFDELFIMGSRYELRHKVAETHPDRLMVQDMLERRSESYEESSEEEFERMLEECQRERTPLQSS